MPDFAKSDREDHEDVRPSRLTLDVGGGTTSILVYEPIGAGPRPAVVIGAEGGGINRFIRGVAASLAHAGYVALVPDYYRGVTMPDPDDYSDIDGMMSMIDALDFRRAAHDFVATIDRARSLPGADGTVAVWGYCTGGTVAMFGACLDRKLGAAVLFYPSQPRFETLTVTRPAHPVDLVWNIACPVMIAYGDSDPVMPADDLADLEQRLAQWNVTHDIKVYPGAGHAFSSPGFAMYDAAASKAAWQDGLAFLAEHLVAAPWHPATG